MMYNEFLAGTGAPENNESYAQFKLIEQIYMDCEHMSKADAYAIWKKTYGKELKAKKRRMIDRAQTLLAPVDEFETLPAQEQTRISHELSRMAHNAWYEGDGNCYSFCASGRCYTDTYGIVWFIKQTGWALNGSAVYGLFAYVDGTIRNAHYRA